MIDNFEHLAARCESMKRRRMIRLSLMITGVLILILSAVFIAIRWSEPPVPLAPAAKAPLPLKAEQNASIPVVATEHNDTNLSSVAKPPLPIRTPVTPPMQITKPLAPAVVKPTSVAPAVVPTATPVATPIPPKNTRLFDVNTQNYESPVEAYKSNPKYETALAAARDFYAKDNFIEAANWAKKANQLNREAEEAWLLYARSYYAQGRKSEAIGILELYLNYKDSKAASELIRTWKLNTTN